MILGTHNSLTYLPPKKWWGYLIRCFARCQRLTIEEQINGGVRYFDIRIRFTNDGIPIIAHGLVEYKGNIFDILTILSTIKDKCYVRVLLETMKDADNKQKYYFDHFIKHCLEFYPNLYFKFGYKNPFITIKTQWDNIKFIEVAKWIRKWWELLLTPRFFVKEQTIKIKELETSKYDGIVAMDFF